ncbi:LytTR family transcriptional regulator [Aquimarina sp. MAR_2010_214]|uniref:LytTR family DNA-binding domain-containing protein n=1 Tax=Aquimarina sp. MAR_2010_214 TaxID=1250026 RepID=UPI000C7148AA|nr:LytTR family DNA-binding domain-containing protein [Aquimarina sp. MAR_2010_214]PKV50610.1 LytTR family transcriptional regulator [Aquimarina sp. MAR_2010_214]
MSRHYIAKIIHKPYPYLFHLKRNLIIAFVLGILICIVNVLAVDQNYVDINFVFSKPFLCTLAGLMTFFSILLVLEVIPRIFFKPDLKENWTVGKECLLIVSLLFVIAIFNNTLSLMISKEPSGNVLLHFLNSSFYVVLLGIAPAFLLVWLNYTILLKENLKKVSLYNEQLESRIIHNENEISEIISIQTSNKNEVIELDINGFLFAKSEGNYIDVYTKTLGKVKWKPYRLTIQKFEEVLGDYPFIISTHRSYVVNIRNINATTGNARNYRISFEGVPHEVPVSRNKFQTFKDAFTIKKV